MLWLELLNVPLIKKNKKNGVWLVFVFVRV